MRLPEPSARENYMAHAEPLKSEVNYERLHVRFGSKADIVRGDSDVRFTPESGH